MSSLTIVRRIKARPQAVFDAFIKPDKIALWWGPDDGPVLSADVDPRLSGRFHVRFRMEDDSEHASGGSFEIFDPPYHIAMTWAWDSEPDVVSRVEVKLRATDNGTEMTFTHSQLPDEASRDSHESGWTGSIDKLESRASELEQA